MVCSKCEKKLSKVVVPDKWKDGARNVIGGKHGGQRIGTRGARGGAGAGAGAGSGKVRVKSKKSKARFNPMARPCRICHSTVHQRGCHYCNDCAYKKGICAMCGRKTLKTKGYKMST